MLTEQLTFNEVETTTNINKLIEDKNTSNMMRIEKHNKEEYVKQQFGIFNKYHSIQKGSGASVIAPVKKAFSPFKNWTQVYINYALKESPFRTMCFNLAKYLHENLPNINIQSEIIPIDDLHITLLSLYINRDHSVFKNYINKYMNTNINASDVLISSITKQLYIRLNSMIINISMRSLNTYNIVRPHPPNFLLSLYSNDFSNLVVLLNANVPPPYANFDAMIQDIIKDIIILFTLDGKKLDIRVVRSTNQKYLYFYIDGYNEPFACIPSYNNDPLHITILKHIAIGTPPIILDNDERRNESIRLKNRVLRSIFNNINNLVVGGIMMNNFNVIPLNLLTYFTQVGPTNITIFDNTITTCHIFSGFDNVDKYNSIYLGLKTDREVYKASDFIEKTPLPYPFNTDNTRHGTETTRTPNMYTPSPIQLVYDNINRIETIRANQEQRDRNTRINTIFRQGNIA